MKLEILINKILSAREPKIKHKYNLEKVLKYVYSLSLSHLGFWLVMDYMENNNLINK